MKKRILIVDDDVMTLKILKKYLEDTYDVVTENAGYRFVEKMGSYDADLILLDIEMPVVNGLQAFDELLKNPEVKDTPVVFLSGISNPNLVQELEAKGAAGYIVKTTPRGELIEQLEKVLSDEEKKASVKEVLIIDDDIAHLKSMRDTLLTNDYKVKVVRSTVDAVEYIKSHHPDLFIIGRDPSGIEPQEVYDSIASTIRSEGVVSLIMEETFFTSELVDHVKKALDNR